ATSATVAVNLLVAPRTRSRAALAGTVFAATLGVATYVDGGHRPGDINAAYPVVGLWTLSGGVVIYRVSADADVISARARAEHASLSETLLWLLAIAGLAGAVAVLWLSDRFATLPRHFADVVPAARWFFFGALLTGGAAATVCAVLASFFRWEAGREAAE